MDRRVQDNTIQEIYKFMGEMRANSELRGDVLEQLEKDLKEMQRTLATTVEKVDNLTKIKASLDDTNKKVDGLISKIGKWEAKLGAFVFLAGCVWAFFLAVKNELFAFLRG
jgi:ABC-type transporter Mla subunit MlaD